MNIKQLKIIELKVFIKTPDGNPFSPKSFYGFRFDDKYVVMQVLYALTVFLSLQCPTQ